MSSTFKTVKPGTKQKRPKVDTGQEIENLTRQLFKATVDKWVGEKIEGKVDKEVLGQCVDNLTALFGSAVETMVTAAADCYLDAAFVDDDDEDEDDDSQEGDDDDD